MSTFRIPFLFATAGLVLAAHAADAYNNLGNPVSYTTNGYFIDAQNTHGFQFTAGATGTLAGFQVAMNDFGSATAQTFGLRLYADNGSNAYGALLGTYSGVSTAFRYNATTSALATVTTGGTPVPLAGGTKYWLEAASGASLVWNSVAAGTVPDNFNGTYGSRAAAAYSVQITPVPEPASLAALALGALVLRRRRRS